MAVSQETAEAYVRWVRSRYGREGVASVEAVLGPWDEFFDIAFREPSDQDTREVLAAWIRLGFSR